MWKGPLHAEKMGVQADGHSKAPWRIMFLKSKPLALCIVLHLFATLPPSSWDLFINALNIH